MNKMNLIVVAVIFIGLTTLLSCSKECNYGYEGDNCRTIWGEKFSGSYSFQDQCNIAGNFSGIATIESSYDNRFSLTITNFNETGSNSVIVGKILDSETVYIESANSGGYTITHATGHYSNGRITWSTFNVIGGWNTDNCSSVWVKQ